MAGGNWETQNKVRPGVYINFQTNEQLQLTIGERGTVAICEPMSWGPVGQVMTVNAGEDTTPFCGYSTTEPGARFLAEMFKGTDRTDGPNSVLLYRPPASSSAEATVTTGVLTATALYPGVRGNDITITITALTEPESTYQVDTLVDGIVVDSQQAATADTLVSNAWVNFSGTGALAATTGQALTGGNDGTVQPTAYSTFLETLEPYDFDVLVYDDDDATVLTAYQTFVERMVSQEGKYCQMVAAEMTNPDSQYVINNIAGAVMSDGTTFTPQQVCWWLGGAEAGASYNESLTYAQYPGAVNVSPLMTNSQYVAAIQAGEIALVPDNGIVKIEQDINSLVTFTQTNGSVFHKNRVIRLCSQIGNDLYQQFSDFFIGQVNNNEQGRSILQSAVIAYLLSLQQQQAIQNFEAEDISVQQGNDIDSVIINLAVSVVDSIEKIYMQVTVS